MGKLRNAVYGSILAGLASCSNPNRAVVERGDTVYVAMQGLRPVPPGVYGDKFENILKHNNLTGSNNVKGLEKFIEESRAKGAKLNIFATNGGVYCGPLSLSKAPDVIVSYDHDGVIEAGQNERVLADAKYYGKLTGKAPKVLFRKGDKK